MPAYSVPYPRVVSTAYAFMCDMLLFWLLSLVILTLCMIMVIHLMTLPACALTYALYYDHIYWKAQTTSFFFFLETTH